MLACPRRCVRRIPPVLVEMRVRLFESQAALPLQRPAAGARNPPPIRIHRSARLGLAAPAPSSARRLCDERAEARLGQADEHMVAVIALVHDHVLDHAGAPVGHGGHRFEFIGRLDQRVAHRGRVALVGALHRHAHHGAGVHVDRVLGLVREMRAPVFHLRDARLGIVWMLPIGVAALLRPLPIQAREVRARRGLDPGLHGESRQKGVVALARIAAHDGPQRRVRFEGRRIHADGDALHQIRLRQHLQHPGEDRAVRFQIDAPARACDRRVLGRGLLETQTEKRAQRQRVGRAPRDAALGILPLEVADQQQAEVAAGEQTRAADGRRVERRALRLDERVKPLGLERAIQRLVERVARRLRQRVRRHPHLRRASLVRAPSHRHGAS